MEKFSEWRDKGTGISPFMPMKQQVGVLGCIVTVLRFPLAIIACALYFIFPFPLFAQLILRLLCGFRRTDVLVDGVKRSDTEKVNANLPNVGDFIICNFSSPFDGLIVASISKANWRDIAILVPNKNGELYQYTIWSLSKLCFSDKFGEQQTTNRVTDYTQLKNKLVLCFLEGTTSNNKAVLPFIDIGRVPSEAFRFKTVSLKIMPAYLTSPVPVSPLRYAFGVLANLQSSSYLRAKIYPHDSDSMYKNRFDFNFSKQAFETSQLNVMGADMDINAKINFYKYYIDYKIRK